MVLKNPESGFPGFSVISFHHIYNISIPENFQEVIKVKIKP